MQPRLGTSELDDLRVPKMLSVKLISRSIKLFKRSTCRGNMFFKVYYLMCKSSLLCVVKYWSDLSSSLFHFQALWFSACVLELLLLNPCSFLWVSSPLWPTLTGCRLLPVCSGPQVPTINAISFTQVSALRVELGRAHIPVKFLHFVLCTYTQLSTWSQTSWIATAVNQQEL